MSENIHHICLHKVQIRLPALGLNPTGDVIRSPKQGYCGPIKGHVSTGKTFLKNLVFRKVLFTCDFVLFDLVGEHVLEPCARRRTRARTLNCKQALATISQQRCCLPVTLFFLISPANTCSNPELSVVLYLGDRLYISNHRLFRTPRKASSS